MTYLQHQLGATAAPAAAATFNYQANAIPLALQALAASPGSTLALVTYGLNGATPSAVAYPDNTSANDAYSAIVDNPGSVFYAVEVDSSGIPWNEWNRGASTILTTISSTVVGYWPWILAGAGVIAAAIYFGKPTPARAPAGGSGTPAAKRRARRSATYRRRTITTWR